MLDRPVLGGDASPATVRDAVPPGPDEGVSSPGDGVSSPGGGERLSRRRVGWLLALLLLVAALIYAVPIWWGVPTDKATWAYDEITPSHVGPRWTILYPPAHRHVLYALFVGVDKLAELTGSSAPSSDDLLLAARGLTVLMGCLTLLLVYRCGRQLGGRAAALLAVAAVAFGTNYVFYSKTANLDIPYVFWFTLSLLFFLRALRLRRWSDHVLFAACGALAIATKTQAYALYLVAPLALAFNLRRTDDGRRQPFWRALLDRRMLEAAGACIAVTLLVFGELRGSGELRAHFEALTSLNLDDYQYFSLSAASLERLAVETLRLLSFVLGAPVFLAALAGLAAALARPRRNARLLSLLLFVVPYWLAFIAATGFSYDRHYLPVAVILSLFAGRALAWLAAPAPPFAVLRRAAVALVLAYALWCGVSVDLMMLGDARYAAERWLAAEEQQSETFGLGSWELLPRGLHYLAVDDFARWRKKEHGTNSGLWHNCRILDRIDAEYLIPMTPAEMSGPGLNFREHRRFRNSMFGSLANPESVTFFASNVVKVARDVVVFRRTGEPCVDAARVPQALHQLRRRNDPELRGELTRAIFESPAIAAQPFSGADMVSLRLLAQGWTAGTTPAGIAVQNQGWREERPELLLRLTRQRAPFPVTVFVDEGERRRSFVFDRPGVKAVALSPLAPGARRLAVVWTDKAWQEPEGPLRGVRLLPGGWPVAPDERLRQLHETLRGLGDGTIGEATRADLVRALRRGNIEDPVEIGRWALMAGGWFDRSTRGTEPAAVLIRNGHTRAARPRLTLSCHDPSATEPLTVSIDGGGGTQRHQLDCTRLPVEVPLDLLEPGAERLYILRSDRARNNLMAPFRSLGVRLKEVRLAVE